MICNAVHHGIETSQELRVTAGKPAIGTITLQAFQQNEYVYIEIHDDGQGLDPKRIRKMAQERGILGPDDILSNHELIQLIFHPGFSIKRNALGVSGSVSGLVAVRRDIDASRGSIELRSESGRGTCVSVRLPLPAAILDTTFECSGEPRGLETTRHCLSFHRNQS
ncbi:Chemotaxis protein CheA [Pirellula sp. SH-Sr6A]|nr:ATP-binding protein [Pirellula sp. SH-Sr6A]AMV31068.1 Chemotaxis protein CheA [Pirellula sp. SH-Sr6A]